MYTKKEKSDSMDYKFQPYLKWAGGKRQIIKELTSRIPTKFGKYIEPFVGAGALFMEIKHPKTIIGEINKDLIASYLVVRDNPHGLMAELDQMNELHKKGQKEYYLAVRAMDREAKWEEVDNLTRASRLIYLNKYCFNGLYRVNSKNEYNVPFNGKEYVNLYDRENILSLSEYLYENKVEILLADYTEICSKAEKGDFIYFDPPYDVLKKETFDSYNEKGFGTKGQKKLAELFKELDKKGCYVMLSNHKTPLIKELYGNYPTTVVKANRQINSKASGRGAIEEVIITNYEPK